MAIQLRSTKDVASNGLKCLVYGHAGAGKTTLIKTMPSPVILSAEGGLLSLADQDIPYIMIATMEDLEDALQWAEQSEEARQFQTIALDSLSEIAEVVLAREKQMAKDARQAYGEMQDIMAEKIRKFRDLQGKHVFFSAKIEKGTDQDGRVTYQPSMPGNKMGQALPYFFDLMFALRVEKDAEGIAHRVLMTDSDGLWQAKGRTTDGNRLDMWEPPDMSHIIAKLQRRAAE